jgi:hypothetical protein
MFSKFFPEELSQISKISPQHFIKSKWLDLNLVKDKVYENT